MTHFKAIRVDKDSSGYRATYSDFDESELMDGDVTVRVSHSTVNYKDGLAITGKSPVVRRFPMIPGIDFAGVVESSSHPDFKPGERVTGWFGWQDYAAVDAGAVERKVTDGDLPLSTSLGVLGLNGITAYFGLLEVGQPKAGETVVVSTAAGAVGSCVGQIAKIKGCRTVGIAGGPTKTALCRDAFGFDAAIDYKSGDLDAALAAACPNGVDVYFDNTAGPISDAVYRHLRVGGRVVVCGTASIASWDPPPQGPRIERHLLVKRARMQGFVVLDYKSRYREALSALAAWVRSSEIRYREDILDGIEHAPGSIAGLYRGENLGKRLIRLAAE